ncbi:hypothetical protein ACEPAH_3146 [Sanghuangporus vaninii]
MDCHTEDNLTTMSSSEMKRSITELSSGLAAMSQSIDKAVNDDVDRLIRGDLALAQTISCEAFLHGLGASENEGCKQKFDEIAAVIKASPEYTEFMTKLGQNDETSRYTPFCNLANDILNRLHDNNSPIWFARNDPHHIHGNYGSIQIPDVVIVRNVKHPLGARESDISKSVPLQPKAFVYQYGQGPGKGNEESTALTWYDVLSVFEFRKVDQSSVGGTYLGGRSQTRSREGSRGNSKSGKRKAVDSESLHTSSKRKASEAFGGYKTKLARYAAHQLSSVFHRRHVISVIIIDRRLIMGYFDHGGAVFSEELDFINEMATFVHLLDALAHLKPRELGFVKTESASLAGEADCIHYKEVLANSSESGTRHSLRNPVLPQQRHPASEGSPEGITLPPIVVKMEGRSVMVRGSIVRRVPFGLIGRGSRVHEATILDGSEQRPLVLKASWQLTRRLPEWEIIKEAQAGLEGLEIVAVKRLHLEECLPTVHSAEEADELLYVNSFRKLTGIDERFHEDSARKFHLVAFELLDEHLHTIKEETIFCQCFKDIFEAHYWIYATTGFLHRDISSNNLMVRVGRDGKKRGVLIDWDLADKIATSEQDHTGTRTGTRTFMAYELFSQNTSKHILRFDWESFLYYLMWVVFVMIDEDYKNTETRRIKDETHQNPETLGSLMARWPKLNDEELRLAKAFAISTKGKYMYSGSVHKFHSTFSTWIDPIWELFIQGDDARMKRDPKFDNNTFGGKLTYEGLHDILCRKLSN